MSDTVFLSIEDMNLYHFTGTQYLKFRMKQARVDTRYYRVKCVIGSSYTFYLYLGPYSADPKREYTLTLPIRSVKNSSWSDITFEDVFTQYPDSPSLKAVCHLQTSNRPDFTTSLDTSGASHEMTIRLVGDDFSPTWVCPTWEDIRYSVAGIAALSGSNQKGVQNASTIRFSLTPATARYGATLDYYSIDVTGGFSHTLSPTHVSTVGTDHLSLSEFYKMVGDVTMKFTVTDSRGLSTSFTRTLTIVPYTPVMMTYNDTHRRGGTGSAVILDFKVKWYGGSPLTLSCTGIVAKEQGSSTTLASLTPTVSSQSPTYSYKAEWSGVTFDPAKSYTITVTFYDTIRTVYLIIDIPVGTPVLSIRDRKIGVNNPSPAEALDVAGTILQNGLPVMGYRGELGDAHDVELNNATSTGYYVYTGELDGEIKHGPTGVTITTPFILVVVATSDYRVQNLYDVGSGARYTRTYKTSWSGWQ